MNGKRVMKTKQPVALVALLLLLCCTVAGTLAYLVDKSGPVTNTFEPAYVTTAVDEKFDGTTKSEVKIKNTGNIPAYIRATIVVNWVNDAGEISGTPVKTTDYTISYNEADWKLIGDYWYCKTTTASGASTEPLIISCAKTSTAAVPDGYDLQVTILADGIQADGVGSNGKTPMQDAWGVAPSALTNG